MNSRDFIYSRNDCNIRDVSNSSDVGNGRDVSSSSGVGNGRDANISRTAENSRGTRKYGTNRNRRDESNSRTLPATARTSAIAGSTAAEETPGTSEEKQAEEGKFATLGPPTTDASSSNDAKKIRNVRTDGSTALYYTTTTCNSRNT
jgi:hypothetical protein